MKSFGLRVYFDIQFIWAFLEAMRSRGALERFEDLDPLGCDYIVHLVDGEAGAAVLRDLDDAPSAKRSQPSNPVINIGGAKKELSKPTMLQYIRGTRPKKGGGRKKKLPLNSERPTIAEDSR